MALAKKYRPSELAELYGNSDLVTSLESVLKRDAEHIPHCFMFTGKPGCGKTTLGRIVSKVLDCHDSEYHEYNAASIRSIDAIREIEKNCQYPPMEGSSRVWLFDEVHQYRSDSQEAMLKMLEEAPNHAFFILCTTDPQKLKKSLISRCVCFEVKPLDEDEMIDMLIEISAAENVKLPEKVASKIAITSDGSPREALQMLEKIKDLNPKEMLKSIERMESAEILSIELCRALLSKRTWSEVSKLIKGLDEEPEQIRHIVLGYANSVLLAKNNPQAALIIECFSPNFYDSGKAGLTLACYQCVV